SSAHFAYRVLKVKQSPDFHTYLKRILNMRGLGDKLFYRKIYKPRFEPILLPGKELKIVSKMHVLVVELRYVHTRRERHAT
ncbi:MAG: hypothetical protein KZQ70_12785, partial [gamma proteobacterium symbiont of Lucinoma myriamae]|nr:hypothetical protein [gamma proteobacterium symbiont of Lucinoma myriamae]